MFSGAQDKKIKQWDVATGTEIFEFSGHGQAVLVLQTVEDQKMLISGGKDNYVKIWGLDSYECLKTLQVGSEVSAIAVRNNHLFIGLTGSIKIWDLTSFKQVKSISSHHKGGIFSLLSTSRYILSGSRDHYINAFNVTTFDFEMQLHPPHYDGVDALSAIEDSYLFSGSRDNAIKLWKLTPNPEDITQTKIVHSAHQDWITSLTIHNNILYSACRDGTVGTWTTDNLSLISSPMQAHPAAINSILSSPQQNVLFTASNDRTVKIWKPTELLEDST
jgi:WD40 repeat protein